MRRLHIPLRHFFATPPTPCPYLPDKLERKVVTLLSDEEPDQLHSILSSAGFRRSQDLAYRPACDACNACIPVRIPTAEFSPSRTQRKIMRKNVDLIAEQRPPVATSEQFNLFRRYLTARHSEGGMADMNIADYRAMIEDTPVDTFMIEYRTDDGELIAACLTDRMNDGLSLVYSFFDPAATSRSLGVFTVQWHVMQALKSKLDYVYLGYWVDGSQKMGYKSSFRPLEGLTRDGWSRMPLKSA